MAHELVGRSAGVAAIADGRVRRLTGSVFSRLFTTSALLLAARLLGAAAGFFVQLVLARHLSAQALGIYFTATSLIVVGGVVAAHGYPSLAVRFVSRYRKPESAALLGAFLRHAQAESLALALAGVAIVAAAAAAWPGLQAETRAALVVAAALIPFSAAFRLYGSLAVAIRAFKLAYLPDVSLKPVVVLAALAAILAAGGELSLLQAMLSLAAATVILSLGQYLLLARRFPVGPALRARPLHPHPPAVRRIASKWRREAHAVLLVAVFSQFFADLAILLASPVLTAAEMGAFGLALKLAFLVGFFVQVTQSIATPDLAEALGRRGAAGGGAKLAASSAAATAATLLAATICLLWGGAILRLFGAGYESAHLALIILVAAQLVRAIFGPTNAVLTLLGERKINLMVTAASVVFLALATAALGALFGPNGVALAVLLTMLLWSAASAYLLHHKRGVRVDLFAA